MYLSDEEILTRVQRGDRELYMELFERHYGRVEAYARRQIRNPDVARDLASETFLRAYRNVDRFRTGEKISYLGYLLMICHRLVLTEHARNYSSPTVSLDEHPREVEDRPDTSVQPLDSVLHGERRTALLAALGQLSPEDQEIIYLAYERDLSRKDIVTVLGKPSVTAVTSHLHRAMKKLKEVVIRQGYFAAEQEEAHKLPW